MDEIAELYDKTRREIVWRLAESLTPEQWSFLSTLLREPCPLIHADKIALLNKIAAQPEEKEKLKRKLRSYGIGLRRISA